MQTPEASSHDRFLAQKKKKKKKNGKSALLSP
jgi:hypothetical protein